MNPIVFLLKHPLYVKSKVWIDSAFSVASMICVPVILLAGITWLASPTSNVKVTTSTTSLEMSPGSSAKIRPDIKMQVSGPKVIYQLQLINKEGTVVFNYPEQTVKDDKLKLETVNVKVPASVAEGEYSLVASVKYLGNPIQTNSVQLDLAHITVGANQKPE